MNHVTPAWLAFTNVTPAWVAVTIVLPVALPLVFALFGKFFFATTPNQKTMSAPGRAIQDGQLGWLSVGWSMAAVYEPFAYQHDLMAFATGSNASLMSYALYRLRHLDWIYIFGSGELFIIGAAVFISVGGALTSDDKRTVWNRYAGWSILVALVSASMLIHVHGRIAAG